MLYLIDHFSDMPVMSLQVGGQIARLDKPIINPNNLRIVGFYVNGPLHGGKILLTEDIRELGDLGAIVDHEDKLVDQEDLVRLHDVLEIDFQLIDKPVITERKKRLGKVSDYIVDDLQFMIQKIHIKQSMLKNWTAEQLVIHRSQIVEITDKKIVIKDNLEAVKEEDREVGSREAGSVYSPAPSSSASTISE